MVETIKHFNQRKIQLAVLLVLIFEFVFPRYSLAVEPLKITQSSLLPEVIIKSTKDIFGSEPEVKVVATYQLIVTAYSSTVDQTDSTPCITANGFDLCEHNRENVIAANFLSFGTKVRIPEYFGDRIFTVQDRMNARYYYRADVWMRTRKVAWDFGAPYTVLEVLE